MSDPIWVLHDKESKLIEEELAKLASLANAKITFLIDKDGNLIASAGDSRHLDTTSLASLTAGNIAATGGITKLLGEKEFSFLFHEGERDHIHLSVIAKRFILGVIFDERSSLGLVRLRARKSGEILTQVVADMSDHFEKDKQNQVDRSPFAAITEADIDRLFG